ncbi:VOC family protein [Streptomyces sp. NPDC093094]|uniref:VOC family protein n=1 Tax=Streptomyces sp. NPDC093094 TaxID=3366026 RepID=UPI003819FA25
MLTTRFVHGAPHWIDVGAPDVDGAGAFYGGLFGWQHVPGGPESGGHGFFRLDGLTVAGSTRTTPGQGPPSWTVYFRSSDADATAAAVRQAHGSVLLEPTTVTDRGRTAVLGDRAGASFGIWQPDRDKGLDLVRAPGSLRWLELYTPDIAAAAGFYHKVLGWETSSVTFPGGFHTCVNPAGEGEEAMFGGLAPQDEDPSESAGAPYWLVHIEVEDTDEVTARAQRLGGTLRTAPADVPYVGRVAVLTDPYGARFAVITSAPRG